MVRSDSRTCCSTTTTRQLVLAGGDGGLAGADALATARWFAAEAGARRTLGFAAVNALSRCLFERAGYLPPESGDSIGGLDPGPGDHVGMVGFFPPLVKRIAAVGARLTVVELKAELAGQYDGYRVTLDAGELADCNKVLSTSTLLLNDTLENILASAARRRGSPSSAPVPAACPTRCSRAV